MITFFAAGERGGGDAVRRTGVLNFQTKLFLFRLCFQDLVLYRFAACLFARLLRVTGSHRAPPHALPDRVQRAWRMSALCRWRLLGMCCVASARLLRTRTVHAAQHPLVGRFLRSSSQTGNGRRRCDNERKGGVWRGGLRFCLRPALCATRGFLQPLRFLCGADMNSVSAGTRSSSLGAAALRISCSGMAGARGRSSFSVSRRKDVVPVVWRRKNTLRACMPGKRAAAPATPHAAGSHCRHCCLPPISTRAVAPLRGVLRCRMQI